MKTITVEVDITLNHDPSLPHILGVDGPEGFVSGENGEVYFSENDGTPLFDLLDAIWRAGHLPADVEFCTDHRDEAWIAHWDDKTLAAMHGKKFRVRHSSVFDDSHEDGDEWIEDRTELVSTL